MTGSSKHVRLYFYLSMNASCSQRYWLEALLFQFDRTESSIAKVSLQVCSAYPADAPFEVLLNEAGPSIVVY